MYQLLSYIKFLFKATNHHGVHSPFVFNFVTKCLYDKTKHPEYHKIETYRNTLKKSRDVLDIVDLGAGSRVLDTQKRAVKAMVNTSSSSVKESEVLFRVARYFNFETILELGTSLGMGTYALALGNSNSQVITIDGCSNTSTYAQSLFSTFEMKQIETIIGSFSEIIPDLDQESFDCIYFDGHHDKAATIEYFEMLLPKAHNHSIFIFDDIYWSRGMTEAWEFIKAHNAVNVTVDTFHLGFVFFRKEQAKEHFRIRL